MLRPFAIQQQRRWPCRWRRAAVEPLRSCSNLSSCSSQQVSDVLDRLLALVVGIRARADRDRHQNQGRGNSDRPSRSDDSSVVPAVAVPVLAPPFRREQRLPSRPRRCGRASTRPSYTPFGTLWTASASRGPAELRGNLRRHHHPVENSPDWRDLRDRRHILRIRCHQARELLRERAHRVERQARRTSRLFGNGWASRDISGTDENAARAVRKFGQAFRGERISVSHRRNAWRRRMLTVSKRARSKCLCRSWISLVRIQR